MKKHSVMLSACLVAALTAATAADTVGPSVERQSVAGARPEALADGKRLYDVNCANCHGARAQGAVKAGFEISIIAERGGKQPPDLTDAAWDHGSSDTEIVHGHQERHSLRDDGALRGAPLGRRDPKRGGVRPFPLVASGGATAAAPGAAPAPQTTERTLEVADYVELPVTGDMSAESRFWRAGARQHPA